MTTEHKRESTIRINGFDLNLLDLRRFLVEAKRSTYASPTAREVSPERPGFKELAHVSEDGLWTYRDSYFGFFSAPGQEIVRYRNVPVWSMSYDGGMKREYSGSIDFAEKTFSFLKQALSNMDENRPFRGPGHYSLLEGKWVYSSTTEGDIERFHGKELIRYGGQEVFSQYFMGGLIIDKVR